MSITASTSVSVHIDDKHSLWTCQYHNQQSVSLMSVSEVHAATQHVPVCGQAYMAIGPSSNLLLLISTLGCSDRRNNDDIPGWSCKMLVPVTNCSEAGGDCSHLFLPGISYPRANQQDT